MWQFEVSDDADSMQMLQRSTQVGEFYYMMAPSMTWSDNENHKHYLGTHTHTHTHWLTTLQVIETCF